uniref:Sensor histidine kinase RcsC (EC) n=1 Tax=Ganoderma boninense TaxID=34458 RepID=A0A5K1JSY8_9APHY|nr:Sensor histidine kinase RcsC (EC [Ganoderma boninense]
MTTAPPRPSPSPRWDGLNEGFVSPARLQQWKQEHERVHPLGSPLGTPQQGPSTNRPAPERRNLSMDSYSNGNGTSPTKPTHRARPSFASFFSRKSSAMDDLPISSPPQAQSPPPAGAPMQQQQQQQQQTSTPPSSFGPQHAHLRRPSSSNHSRLMQQQQPAPPPQQPPAQQPQSMQGPPPPSQAPPPSQGPGGAGVPAQGPPLHPEIKSVVQLTLAHTHKVYFSGPLVRRIERQTDGQKPAKDEGWREVWAQLGGTTLSVWDMEEIQEASKQGRQVPPAYINVTDARYTNVLTLNTAGSNLYFFSCPSPEALVQWTAAMRLAAWEKSRLEEIYTAHLIRITLNDGRGTPSTLVNGRLEGWVRIRIAGQTDWKRMWMVISAGSGTAGHPDHASITSQGNERPESPNAPRRRRMSNLFSREKTPVSNLPAQALIQAFTSPKPRDRKKALLTMHTVSQAFAVYPERPELISRSTLMKLEGKLGEEEVAGILKGREAWLLVMPELEGANTRASEMLRWLIAIHDAFELYGRPKMYSWDPRDIQSMMFAYPIGPHRDVRLLVLLVSVQLY